jgi:single-strand DNA-binding protein
MINRVILVGRLTKDPELRYTPSGVAVATFTLAVNRPFTNQSGEREADFVNIVVWRRLAENVANYLKKGSMAGVDGRIQTRSYESQEGKRVYVTEVVADTVQFLEPKASGNGGNTGNNANNFGGDPFGGDPFGGSNPYGSGSQGGMPGNNYGGYNSYDDDPFANDGTPIDISDDDLPF